MRRPVTPLSSWAPNWIRFAQVPGANQVQGSEILIAGASAVDSAMYGSRAQVARFASPDFNAEIVPRGEWGSIGSGSDVAQYRNWKR
jgi:hypothetical protein